MSFSNAKLDLLKEELLANQRGLHPFTQIATEDGLALLARLEFSERVNEKAEELITHPAFTEATLSFSRLPQGIAQRAVELRDSLEAWRKASGHE